MNREALEKVVDIRHSAGTQYIRTSDIPEPFRGQFVTALFNSTTPIIEEEACMCHFVYRWQGWLRWRFSDDYVAPPAIKAEILSIWAENAARHRSWSHWRGTDSQLPPPEFPQQRCL